LKYLERRGNHIPLQHITGEQEFMGLTFKVNDHVLIPRQDTEILVEEALKRLKPDMSVLDMCTGSGCIIISLKYEKPQITAFASDISNKALTVAKDIVEGLMEEVKNHEPRIALDGMEDGLYFYKEIIKRAKEHLNPCGFLCFEIGYDQGEAVTNLMMDEGFYNVSVIKDLAGLDRVVIGNT
jgi:release factor glutamine methyltransferase